MKYLTFDELKKEIFSQEIPSWSRKGQFVFNYIDTNYGVARKVQFADGIDCFYNDDEIDNFIIKSVEQINKNKDNYESLKERWKKLEPFDEDVTKIPNLPITSKEDWDEFFVPILIKCGALAKKDLIIGKTYLGSCRNSDKAVWKGDVFTYSRTKFGSTFDEDINHFEDDNGYDLFVPIKML